MAPDINKVKQAEIKIGKILVGGAIKENVTCICVWGFFIKMIWGVLYGFECQYLEVASLFVFF